MLFRSFSKLGMAKPRRIRSHKSAGKATVDTEGDANSRSSMGSRTGSAWFSGASRFDGAEGLVWALRGVQIVHHNPIIKIHKGTRPKIMVRYFLSEEANGLRHAKDKQGLNRIA